MGGKAVLKEGVVPHKFVCQGRLQPVNENRMVMARKRKIQEILQDKQYISKNLSTLSSNDTHREDTQVVTSVEPPVQHEGLQKNADYVEPQTSQESQPRAAIEDEEESDTASSQSHNLPPSESLATSREKELLDKLAQAEERQLELMQACTVKKDEVPVAVRMIKNIHELVSMTLGDIGVPLATIYVSDMVKFMLALVAYKNNTGPMPQVVVDQSSSLEPGTSSQVHETMLPPANFSLSNRPSSVPIHSQELGQQDTGTQKT